MKHEPQPDQPNSSSEVEQDHIVELAVPASLGFLPVLCAALREYCAALPSLLQVPGSKADTEQSLAARSNFGTEPLKLPGNNSPTIVVSYSHLVYSLELALQEAATNIVRHGYGGDDLTHKISLRLSTHPADHDTNYRPALVIELEDNGQPFDTAAATYRQPDPDQLQESGYGIYLIHKLTDQLHYWRENGSNRLQIIKFLG